MRSVIDVARQLAGAGEGDGVAFLVAAGAVPRIICALDWTPLREGLARELWRASTIETAAIVARPPLVAALERDAGGAPLAALIVEAPEAHARSNEAALLGLVRALRALHENSPAPPAMTGYERWLLADHQRHALIMALESVCWNVSALADAWEVSRPALYRAVKRHGIPLNRTPVATRRQARRGTP